MQRKDKISVIVPCYNEEDVLSLFLQEVEKVFAIMQEKHGVEMEYLFVDDGSRDGTFRFLKQAAKENPRVNYLSFSRNFGKEAAMFAGLEHATGDYVVILDSGRIAAEGTPLALKNTYTGDFITLYGVDEAALRPLGLHCETLRDAVRVAVPDTAAATKLILEHPELFTDYEITKGKMDDVFLAVTGKKLTGGTEK